MSELLRARLEGLEVSGMSKSIAADVLNNREGMVTARSVSAWLHEKPLHLNYLWAVIEELAETANTSVHIHINFHSCDE